jgi:hypothetical protein
MLRKKEKKRAVVEGDGPARVHVVAVRILSAELDGDSKWCVRVPACQCLMHLRGGATPA